MNITSGQFVEICSSEPIRDPFVVSMVGATSQVYYVSSIIRQDEGDKFLVYSREFINVINLKHESVSRHQLRPSPPELKHKFVVFDMVDAFVDSAWRVGFIMRIDDFGYHVKLVCDRTVEILPHARIRLHLEWDGSWRFHNHGVLAPVPQNMIKQNEFQRLIHLQGSLASTSEQRVRPIQGGLPPAGTPAPWPWHRPQAITLAQWDHPRGSTLAQVGLPPVGTSAPWLWHNPQAITLAQWIHPRGSTSAQFGQPHVSSLAHWGQLQALHQGGQPLEQLDQPHGSSSTVAQMGQLQPSTSAQYGNQANTEYQRDQTED